MRYSITRLSRSRFLLSDVYDDTVLYQLLVVPVKKPDANYQLILVAHGLHATVNPIFQQFDLETYSTFVYASADAIEPMLEVFCEMIQDMDLSNPVELCTVYGGIVRSEFRGKVRYRNTH